MKRASPPRRVGLRVEATDRDAGHRRQAAVGAGFLDHGRLDQERCAMLAGQVERDLVPVTRSAQFDDCVDPVRGRGEIWPDEQHNRRGGEDGDGKRRGDPPPVGAAAGRGRARLRTPGRLSPTWVAVT